jgi:hypothetical protein
MQRACEMQRAHWFEMASHAAEAQHRLVAVTLPATLAYKVPQQGITACEVAVMCDYETQALDELSGWAVPQF